MAKIGLSKPYYAVYNWDGDEVAYQNGDILGKYTQVNIAIDNADDNILYADNAPAETATEFTGGTFTMTTDDLAAESLVAALGLAETPISATGVTTLGAKWVEFNDDQNVPYLGIGGIIKRQVHGATKWQAFILPKVKFQNPSIAVTTKGETIEWQTQELSAKINRSDEGKHNWFRISTYLASEAEAEAAITAAFNIPYTPPASNSVLGGQ